MKKMYLKATEAEMEMQEARNNANFKFENEAMIIDNLVKNAKRGMVGDKVQLVIDPMMIHIPSWQRRLTLAKALQIGTSYNKYKWDVPKVLIDNGKLYVIDGQHRIYGAFKANKTEVVVEIMECTKEEAIDLFINQSKDRQKMCPMDVYNAAIAGNKEEYVRLKEICGKHHVAVKGEDNTNCVGTLTSITDGIKTDPKMLDSILDLLGRLEWNGYADTYNGKAYTAKVIRGIKRMYNYCSGKEKDMEDILVEKCKGTEFFVKNILPKTQAQIFDELSTVVRREMENPFRNKVIKAKRAI